MSRRRCSRFFSNPSSIATMASLLNHAHFRRRCCLVSQDRGSALVNTENPGRFNLQLQNTLDGSIRYGITDDTRLQPGSLESTKSTAGPVQRLPHKLCLGRPTKSFLLDAFLFAIIAALLGILSAFYMIEKTPWLTFSATARIADFSLPCLELCSISVGNSWNVRSGS